ncbi:MAG TPA: AAA family ATPase, partial [Vicinamibacterales bacterium]|nr:AAA family ATPase [Vicinamibacterales bacterium]
MNYETARGPAFYEDFFKFHRPPFSLAPDTRFRFQSASHSAALSQITYALERREPVVVVTGEIGTGKTLLCRTVVEQSGRKTFVSVINDPQLACDELLKRMLEDFGVISKDRTAMTPTSRHDLVHALQDFLSSLVPLGAHAVVIVDEAQHMQPDVLEQMRLIANVQNERGTLLQLILVGQTDLDALLAQPSLRQLSQRVSRVVRLEPLSEQELPKYIQHRLGVARAPAAANSNFPGARELERELAAWDVPSPDFPFTPEAVATIGRISHGIPRVVNLLCDRALEAASSQQLPTVDAPMIAAAAQALALPALEPVAVTPLPAAPQIERMEATDDAGPVQRKPPAARLYALVATVVALAVVAIWLGVRALSGPSPGETPPAQPAPRPQPAAPPPSAPPP